MGADGHAWNRAYAVWNQAYLGKKRAVFLAAASRTEPVLLSIAHSMYRSAATMDDPVLRGWYERLTRAYLDQAAGISLADSAVRRSDLRGLARGIHLLDGARAHAVSVSAQFIAFVERRFGRKVTAAALRADLPQP
jgi:hypothetical protein